MIHQTSHAEQHATFKLNDLYCLECADAVERALRAQPHVTSVHLDWAHNLVHVGYHAGMITSRSDRAGYRGHRLHLRAGGWCA